eukprot:6121811-Pyramimonas_sp.AAC.1
MQLIEAPAEEKVAASAREAGQKVARALQNWEVERDKLRRKLNGHQVQRNPIRASSAASPGTGSAAEPNAAAAQVSRSLAPPAAVGPAAQGGA